MVMLMAVAAAKPVSPRQAADVASAFFPNEDLAIAEIGDIYLFTPVNSKGFVLVAGDDCVRPVLAWSPSDNFPLEEMPQHVRHWIDGYQRELKAMVESGATPSPMVTAEWERYRSGAMAPRPKATRSRGPLLTTVWNQRPYYNALCPFDETDSTRCVAGCVATAMTQVMKYWNHPAVGWGSYSYTHPTYGVLSAQFDTTHYRWSLMPDTLNSSSSEEQVMAVAELTYHAGVAVGMNYSPSASGAYVNSSGYVEYPSAEDALKTYFLYNPLIHSEYKSEYSDREWDSLIRSEIDAAQPVLYSGVDSSGGHAFVLDGYDSTGMFHVNWGWGGAYDGYYTLDSLSPGAGGIGGNATYTFNINNTALIGIRPAIASANQTATINMVSSDDSLGSIEGNGIYDNIEIISITARAATGCRFVRWTSGSKSNPRTLLTVCDLTDTAIFERINGDTLGYCYDAMRTSWQDDYSDTTEWGIRIPSSMLQTGHNLTAVQMYVYTGGDYTLRIYYGDSIEDGTLVYTQQFRPEPWQGWQTIMLDSTLMLDRNLSLWITMSYVGMNFPAANSRYSGNSDGSWYHLPWGWRQYDLEETYMTWMLRGIFATWPVTVDVSAANDEVCTVFGGGNYMSGDEVTVGAIILDPRCRFDHWSDGTPTTPYTFTVYKDTTLVAHCHCDGVGIEDIDEQSQWTVTERQMEIVSSQDAELFDIRGRSLGQGRRFKAPGPGVYILRSGAAAKKIVTRFD